VASWYDAFRSERLDPAIHKVLRSSRPEFLRHWTAQLLTDPHGFGRELDIRIAAAEPGRRREERYRALQAASRAFETSGIITVLNRSGSGWSEIRQHWRFAGTLTRDAPGLLLPKRGRPCDWQRRKPDRKVYDHASHFDGFLRWTGDETVDVESIRIRVLSDPPVEWVRERLTLAVVPLPGSMDDLDFQPVDEPLGHPAFRVSLKDPERVKEAAETALTRAAELGCDIVMFPELCVTERIQEDLAAAIKRLPSRFGGRPWLVVAGSAHTELPEPGHFHNRARVFDGRGEEVLRHNKLHPYVMASGEQDRYGIVDALRGIPREEDIVCVPRELRLLETAIGRVAVIICEDLSVRRWIDALVDSLEIDWLFVPVMDGAQTRLRWTGRYASGYAYEHGVFTLVATCGALMSAHRKRELSGGEKRDPGAGVGLLVRGAHESQIEVLTLDSDAHEPIVITLTG
jgi:predicted amidohydrolase